jgi:hypothetical protein
MRDPIELAKDCGAVTATYVDRANLPESVDGVCMTPAQLSALVDQVIEECAAYCESRLPLLKEAEGQLSGDEMGAKCCVIGRQQQAEQCARGIRSMRSVPKQN